MSTFPVRIICFRREQPFSRSMSARRTSFVGLDVDDEEPGFGDVVSPGFSLASSVTTSVQVKVEEFTCVWDFPKVDRFGGKGATKSWKCGWCGSLFQGWNATKALYHVTKSKKSGTDIKPCSGNIPREVMATFIAFQNKKLDLSTTKRQYDEAFTEEISTNQMSMAVAFEGSRTRSSNSSGGVSEYFEKIHGDGGGGVSAFNATKLTSAIAEFVYCKGLSFSSVEGPHFMEILRLAKLVPTSYRPPTRKVLANELLDISYGNRMATFMNRLEIDVDVYGLSLFGDGATVHGMPLMNILASGVSEPSAVLAIVDCKFLLLFAFFDIFYFTISDTFFHLCRCCRSPRYKPSHRWKKEGCNLYRLLV
jgi:hypothetical protein